MLKIGEVMTLTSRVIAHAEARKPGHRVITAAIASGLNVRPWKRAAMWVCIVLSSVSLGILTALGVWFMIPVALLSIWSGIRYLCATKRSK